MAELETGSVFAGHRIDGSAGKGGMGVVYRASDLQLDRPVALKVVSPEFASDPAFAERFKRESRLAASLDHPNVIPIYHAGEEDGRLYVTMRFVKGTDLAEVLKRDRRLYPERAAAGAAASVPGEPRRRSERRSTPRPRAPACPVTASRPTSRCRTTTPS